MFSRGVDKSTMFDQTSNDGNVSVVTSEMQWGSFDVTQTTKENEFHSIEHSISSLGCTLSLSLY
jgi:hypothetical protein